MVDLNWTKELPSKLGYYWWRPYKYKSHSIYFVFQGYNGVTGKYEGDFYCRWCHQGLYDKQIVKEVKGEWYGPIQEPEM